MTDEEIDRAIRRTLTECAAVAKSIEGPSVRVLAASVAMLCAIVGEQQKRIRDLEMDAEDGTAP